MPASRKSAAAKKIDCAVCDGTDPHCYICGTPHPIAPEYERASGFIRNYVVVPEEDLVILTVWAMHTWLFSPACVTPPTTPYLYIAGDKGSGKTTLGQDVMGLIVRSAISTVSITGAGMFRLIGGSEDENGESNVNAAPTLTVDEVDTIYSGGKDEGLRAILNTGYRRGATVPRVVGKQVINYPTFCPKILMGILNGHLPDTVTDRSIRIDMHRASAEEMQTVEDFFHYEAEDEGAEIANDLALWAQRHSQAIREYKPRKHPGIARVPRHWEVSRTLILVARFAGVEGQLVEALANFFERNRGKDAPELRILRMVRQMFTERDAAAEAARECGDTSLPTDRLTTNEILTRAATEGVPIPGSSGKGLGVLMERVDVKGKSIRVPEGHPDRSPGGNARGYFRSAFEEAYGRIPADD